MSVKEHSYEECKAFLQRHSGVITQISMLFYSPDNHRYHDMVCDLSTYLWKVYCDIPPKLDYLAESAWVYTVIYHKADDASLGEVIYWPAATTNSIEQPQQKDTTSIFTPVLLQ